MNIEKMREEFEAAFVRELDFDLSGYRHVDCEGLDCYQFDGDSEDERSKMASIAFLFWKQSRESLVIELPVDDPLGKGPGDCEGGLPSFEQQRAAECNAILADCREAIHAAGVKTK